MKAEQREEVMTAECPDIIVYEALADAPSAMRYAAAMVPRIVPAKGKVPASIEPGTSWLATGRTPDEARGKLVAMWMRQYPPISEKEAARRAALSKASQKGEG